MAKKTVKPTGLSLVRTAEFDYTGSWKVADSNYDGGTQFQWMYRGVKNWEDAKKYKNVTILRGETSGSFSFNGHGYAGFFPTANWFITAVYFRVRGKRASEQDSNGNAINYDWSDWVGYTLWLNTPSNPIVTQQLDDTLDNKTTFSWEVITSDNDNKPFHDFFYQTMLIKNCNETNGAKLKWNSSQLGWQTGRVVATSGSKEIVEDSALFANGSYTRWLRVQSRGPAFRDGRYGYSNWSYAKHVYATPFWPDIVRWKVAVHKTTTLECTVWFRASQSASQPIDYTTLQYTITTPQAGFKCPSGASWTDLSTISDTGGDDAWHGFIDNTVGLDQCLWFRMTATHDRRTNYSYADDNVWVGKLTPPSGLNVEVNTSTYRATITATNNSAVPDSRLAVTYRGPGASGTIVLGFITHGETQVTVTFPNSTENRQRIFGVYAFQGSYTSAGGSPTRYTVKANMQSDRVEESIAGAPAISSLTPSDDLTEVAIRWSNPSGAYNTTEISWSNRSTAWDSTDQPSTYEVSNLHSNYWIITGLEPGQTYYFKMRAGRLGSDDTLSYGPYSTVKSIELTASSITTISTPVLSLSKTIAARGENITASWSYVATDGAQTYAEIALKTGTTDSPVYTTIAHATTLQHATFAIPSSWSNGSTYDLSVRIKIDNKETSSWSNPASIAIADPPVVNIEASSFSTITVGGRSVKAWQALPATVTLSTTVSGAEKYIVVIQRASDYHVNRPDEDEFNGYEGETVFSYTLNADSSGTTSVTIDNEHLTGYLDDGASYRLIATAVDGLGQTDTAEQVFEIHWSHQAQMPDGQAEILVDKGVAVLSPIAPETVAEGDVCDIYRLSVDKPELVFAAADFGEQYVDPYPTIGETGGYRFVFKTANGDYITEDNVLAWKDVETNFQTLNHIIDFGENRINLMYNVDLSSSWSKDFKETQYLGGSVQGDWNPAVSRTGTVNSVAVIATDTELIEQLRRLAVYPGVCHIRTRDGSSYDANIDVSETRGYEPADLTANFSLSITRVDPESPAGMTYEEWLETQED